MKEGSIMPSFGKHLMLVLLCLLFLSACSSGQGADEQELTIAVIPSLNQGDMQKAMNKLKDHLEKELGMKVSITVYSDYNGVVEAMNYGKVDMAYFGPFTYVKAHQDSGAKAIITQLIKGEPYYYSYIITHKDSPYNSIDDLVANSKNVTFAFGDPNSTSGSLIPGLALKEKGVFRSEQDHDFKGIVFTGGHDATALAVENKQVDAGAIDSAIFNMLIETHKIDGNHFKVIWKSDKLFQYPWAVKKEMSEEMIAKLRAAFFKVKDPEILNAFGATGFTEANDSDYENVRKAAKAAGKL